MRKQPRLTGSFDMNHEASESSRETADRGFCNQKYGRAVGRHGRPSFSRLSIVQACEVRMRRCCRQGMGFRMQIKWFAVATALAMVSGTGASAREARVCDACPNESRPAWTADRERSLKGYDIASTGLRPSYPKDYACPPLTSTYASWIDVDGSRRKERHSGVDGGRLGDPIVAPAPGTVRRVWMADWGWGREGAVLLRHSREDLHLTDGPLFYYSEFDHLKYSDISNLKEGQRIARGQRLAQVFRPGGKSFYLPEVHFEVYQVGEDKALEWRVNARGMEFFTNRTARLIDPLYLLSLEVRPNARLEAPIQPFEPNGDYREFKGFTYFLECQKRGP
jgi:murein DD-endopeptidase MepM/ murein hydrolase activator NlpD